MLKAMVFVYLVRTFLLFQVSNALEGLNKVSPSLQIQLNEPSLPDLQEATLNELQAGLKQGKSNYR
jgi:hypothetical protein